MSMTSDSENRLTTLEVHMEDLIGNGQPGRVGRLEAEVKSHSKLIWVGMGVLAALQFMNANGLLRFIGK